ncbi:MAG: YesL family protein [Clostridia bacterium]|nr:YesL family protein [Clostridia bacterium]
MSLLSNRYTKEGPGVYEEDLNKGPAARFFGVLGRKFWKIATLNLMYVVGSLPVIALAIVLAPALLRFLFPKITVERLTEYFGSAEVVGSLAEGITPEAFSNMVLVFLYVLTAVFLVSMAMFVLGPVHAGMTYVLRNYSREEHAFIWSDFWEHAKKNAGQSLVASLIGIVASVAMVVSLGFYRSVIDNQFLRLLVTGFILLVFTIFTVMQMYIYPMMVTFKLSLKNIYKNAFLFFTLRLFPNLGIFLIGIVLNLIVPALLLVFLQLLGFYILILYYVVIGFGIQFLLTNFYAYQQLDRFMIQRLEQEADLVGEQEGVTLEDMVDDDRPETAERGPDDATPPENP